jgi:2-amino-4-hydroxy-6-hydroxymethyldihydropteridine diphosphokinase
MTTARVAVALGSNLGDRASTLAAAVAALSPILESPRCSPWYDTEPVGVGPQPRFLNGVVVGETTLTLHAFFHQLMTIEARLGRVRPFWGAPRTIDLDLVLFGDQVVREVDLVVPHPRFRERAFVLQPLADVAPEWRDPVSGRTVAQLLIDLVGGAA